MNELSIVQVGSVTGYMDKNYVAYIKLEDAALGLGIVKVDKKNGVEYTRIHAQNLKKWLISFGLIKSENEDLPEYIPEEIFYLLAMKANNDVARAFQRKIAYEILPQIRKKGFYGSLTREDLMGRMRRMKISAEEYEEFLTGIPAYKKPMPVKMYNRTVKEWEENGERIYTLDDLPAAMRENMDLLESYIYKINRKSKNYHMIAYRPGAIKFSFGGLEKILDYGIRNKIIKRKDYMEALGIQAGIK